MTGLFNVFRRNIKLFFKDKGMFFSSLITPIILLVLYATFLANIYKQSFSSALPQGVIVPQELLDGTVVCQLVASLLAVCCVTVSFCANLLMINDRANKTVIDFKVSPVKHGTLAIGYYLASAASTLTVVSSDSRSLPCPPIETLPRRRLASSATGGASALIPVSACGYPHRRRAKCGTLPPGASAPAANSAARSPRG